MTSSDPVAASVTGRGEQPRAARKWPGSGDVAALVAVLLFIATEVAVGMVVGVPHVWQLVLLVVAMLAGVVAPLVLRLHQGGDVSLFLLVPTIMSATQNVYLLPTADTIGKDVLQVFIITNFLVAVCTVGSLWVFRPAAQRGPYPPLMRTTTWLMVGVSLWGFATVVLFHTDPLAAFASYRNFMTPFVFLLMGLLASRTSAALSYARHLVGLGVLVIAFGFVERFTSFWQHVPLDKLWHKKDLSVIAYTHYPLNFFSSEMIGGVQLRRMVSSFADPVNLGTFLFAVFVAAWFTGRYATGAWSVVAAVLTVSKGALIGFLMFAFFRTRYLQSTTAMLLAAGAAGAGGLGFFVFQERHSTGSTTAHIDGLTGAIAGLPSHPLGHGMGGSGVLAGLFSNDTTTVSAESGLGVIIAQLGLIGLVLFLVFFVGLTRACLRLPDATERVVAMSLLIGFTLNAMFNEVALSPNSAAPYFVLVGLLVGAQAYREADERAIEAAHEAQLVHASVR